MLCTKPTRLEQNPKLLGSSLIHRPPPRAVVSQQRIIRVDQAKTGSGEAHYCCKIARTCTRISKILTSRDLKPILDYAVINCACSEFARIRVFPLSREASMLKVGLQCDSRLSAYHAARSSYNLGIPGNTQGRT